jgi:hypothetical protein
MPYKVKVRGSHPSGRYSRGGFAFGRAPVTLTDEQMTDRILNDPWLEVTREATPADATPAAGADEQKLQSMTVAQLKEFAQCCGITLTATKKDGIIAEILGAHGANPGATGE